MMHQKIERAAITAGEISADLNAEFRRQFDDIDGLSTDIDNLSNLVHALSRDEDMDECDRSVLRSISYHLDRLHADCRRISDDCWPLIGVHSND